MCDTKQGFIFYSKIPDVIEEFDIYPMERKKEIEETSNEIVKKEKTFVWILLLKAIKKTYGYDLKDIIFQKTENGKWICDKCYISISHRKKYVCVALGNIDIGVDIEENKTVVKNLYAKIVNEKEKEQSVLENPIELWVKKESVFKLLGEKRFIPNKINTNDYVNNIFKLTDNYLISVSTKEDISLKLFEINDIKELE